MGVPASGRGHLGAGWRRSGRTPGLGAGATGSLSCRQAPWPARVVSVGGAPAGSSVLWSSGPGLPCQLSQLEGGRTGGSQARLTLPGCVVGAEPGRGPCALLGPRPAPPAAAAVLTTDCRGQGGCLGAGHRVGLPARRGLRGLCVPGVSQPAPRFPGPPGWQDRCCDDRDRDVSLLFRLPVREQSQDPGEGFSWDCHQGPPREGTSARSHGERCTWRHPWGNPASPRALRGHTGWVGTDGGLHPARRGVSEDGSVWHPVGAQEVCAGGGSEPEAGV